MGLLLLIAAGSIILLVAYFTYGAFLSKTLALRSDKGTPAVEFRDGIDFEPANKFYLLGQHLSAIAAAGPIIGPILAGLWFGWLPAILWIVFGAIFVGGVHDLTSLIASVRHKGRSIAEVIRSNMSRRSFVLFLLFLWLSLVYIITAFTDITANTFIEPRHGAAVASSSMMYLALAVVMGIVMRRFRLPLVTATAIFLPLVLVCIYLGRFFPLNIPPLFGMDGRASWDAALILYCFVAAVIPVWLLLQPRGYLGGFFLVITVFASLIGIIIGGLRGGFDIEYPALTGFMNPQGLPLFPVLFTTVACGACSGFHAIVASGTTSKQLAKETDAKLVGYGGMLLEGVVAIVALSTLMILNSSKAAELNDPNMIYANGIATFLNVFGIDKGFALNFALLAFATFVYDTLDVATRLGRYIFEELTGWKTKLSPFIATACTLALPFLFVTKKMVDSQGNAVSAWKVFWTVFGASNQLLAGFVLFVVSVWLLKSKKRFAYTLLPAVFMIAMAGWALYFIIKPYIGLHGGRLTLHPIAVTASILVILGAFILAEGVKIFVRRRG